MQILWFLHTRLQHHCKYCGFCIQSFKIIVNTVFCMQGFRIIVNTMVFASTGLRYIGWVPSATSNPGLQGQLLWLVHTKLQTHCKYCGFYLQGFRIFVNIMVFDARLQHHYEYCGFCIQGFNIIVNTVFFGYKASHSL